MVTRCLRTGSQRSRNPRNQSCRSDQGRTAQRESVVPSLSVGDVALGSTSLRITPWGRDESALVRVPSKWLYTAIRTTMLTVSEKDRVTRGNISCSGPGPGKMQLSPMQLVEKVYGQGHSWLKMLHLDWNIPRGLEALRVFVLLHRKHV